MDPHVVSIIEMVVIPSIVLSLVETLDVQNYFLRNGNNAIFKQIKLGVRIKHFTKRHLKRRSVSGDQQMSDI